MAVSVVLLGGLASALMVASHAMPDNDLPSQALLNGALASEQIAADLLEAQSFTEFTPTVVTFTVADRNHGGVGPETIRYSWSGILGDPLTRQYNGGTIANLLDNVNDFSLTYTLEPTSTTTTAPGQEFPFTQIARYDLDATVAEQEFLVSTDSSCGEFISPDPAQLPTGTTQWQLTDVYVALKSKGKGNQSGNMTAIQLRPANADRTPTSTILDQLDVDEGTLSSKSWTTIHWTISGAPWIASTDGICIVIEAINQVDTCRVLFQSVPIPSGNVSFLQAVGVGASFGVDNTQTMTMFSVYGTAKTSAGTSSPPTSFLQSVMIGVQVGAETSAHVETATDVLNQPEVVTP